MRLVRLFIFLFTVLGLISFTIPAVVHAQTTPERQLSISPLRSELVIEAGTSKTGTLMLYNTGKNNLNVQMSTEAFNVINENYDYSFKKNSPLVQWVQFSPANFQLNAGSSQSVTYAIDVPLTSDHGGKYLSLFASSDPNQSASPISTVERVGSLVYLTIPGNITKTGALLSLRSPLVAFGDSTWSATIQNSGTAHFRSYYTTSIQTLWGQELKTNEDSALILPNSIRLISDDLLMPRWLGVYNVQYTIDLGDNESATETRLLFYLPPSQTIGFSIVIVLFIVTLVSIHRRISRKKRRSKTSSSEE